MASSIAGSCGLAYLSHQYEIAPESVAKLAQSLFKRSREVPVRLCGPTDHLPIRQDFPVRLRFCDERPGANAADQRHRTRGLLSWSNCIGFPTTRNYRWEHTHFAETSQEAVGAVLTTVGSSLRCEISIRLMTATLFRVIRVGPARPNGLADVRFTLQRTAKHPHRSETPL
jgi:hypothetical protein